MGTVPSLTVFIYIIDNRWVEGVFWEDRGCFVCMFLLKAILN